MKDFEKKTEASEPRYDAWIGKGIELEAEYTLIPEMSPVGITTSTGASAPWVQGGCTDGTYYYYCMITNDAKNPPATCVILKYDLATRTFVGHSPDLLVGHSQDAAYNPDENTFLIGSGDGKYYVVDAETLTLKKTFQLSHGAHAISYDVNKKQYIIAVTNVALYFYDADFNLKSQVSNAGMLSTYPENGFSACQGMVNDEKYVYWTEYFQSNDNYKDIRCNIVILDIETGEFVDRIALKMGREVENIVIWNNSFYIVCNNLSWTGAECYQIKLVPKS